MKFIKENKLFMLALVVIILSAVLFALPGQTFSTYLIGEKVFKYKLSGYQFIFGTYNDALNKVIGSGVAALALLALSAVALFFSHKSSFVAMLTGLAMLVSSILFFTLPSYASTHKHAYKGIRLLEKNYCQFNWVLWVVAALLLIASALVIYKSVMMLKDEMKKPAKASATHSYNYLRK